MLRNKESEQLIKINKTMKQCHGRKATTKLKKRIRHKAHMCIEKKKINPQTSQLRQSACRYLQDAYWRSLSS